MLLKINLIEVVNKNPKIIAKKRNIFNDLFFINSPHY